MALLAKSGVGRNINRHYYTPEEIDQALQRPVVQSLFELIRFRNRVAVDVGNCVDVAAEDWTARVIATDV